MNILITGGFGVMGRALKTLLPEARALSRAECDVRDPARVSFMVRHYAPDVVVHAAAITDHQHPSASDLIETNIEGTRATARACRAFGVRMVYLSTHYVYGGEAPEGGYDEMDPLAPIGAYAWSKLAGERWVEALVPDHTIVRGSWYTPAKVRGWAERGALVNAWHNRMPVAEAARALAALIQTPVRGIVNIGARTRETFHATARRELPGEPVEATTLADFDLGDGPYPFPRDTTVSTARWEALRA
jgi:dTDP-4-dehydrorhamnose reductase